MTAPALTGTAVLWEGQVSNLLGPLNASTVVLPDGTVLVSMPTGHDGLDWSVRLWHLDGTTAETLSTASILVADATYALLAPTIEGAVLLTADAATLGVRTITADTTGITLGAATSHPGLGSDLVGAAAPVLTTAGLTVVARMQGSVLVLDGTTLLRTVSMPATSRITGTHARPDGTVDLADVDVSGEWRVVRLDPATGDTTVVETFTPARDYYNQPAGVPYGEGRAWVGEWRPEPGVSALTSDGTPVAYWPWPVDPEAYGLDDVSSAITPDGTALLALPHTRFTPSQHTSLTLFALTTDGFSSVDLPMPSPEVATPGGSPTSVSLTAGDRGYAVTMRVHTTPWPDVTGSLVVWVGPTAPATYRGVLHIDTLTHPYWLVGTADPDMAYRLHIDTGTERLVEILAGQDDQATHRLRVCDGTEWPVAAYLRPE